MKGLSHQELAQGTTLAQLIGDNNRPSAWISHEERAREWRRERVAQMRAVRTHTCALCSGELRSDDRDGQYLRCAACGHLAFAGMAKRPATRKRRRA